MQIQLHYKVRNAIVILMEAQMDNNDGRLIKEAKQIMENVTKLAPHSQTIRNISTDINNGNITEACKRLHKFED